MTFRSAALVALVLALLATSCGDDSDDASDTPTTDSATEVESTTTTTTATEPAPSESESDEATETTTTTATEGANESPYDGYVSEIYDDPEVWICWPGADDTCAENQDLTLVSADGSLEVVPFTAVEDAPVDCFYVYPTISGDQTANSDLIPQPGQEIFTTRSQAARYGSTCRVFAPVYRQNTLASMRGSVQAPEGVSTYEVAYADVRDAFAHYMATANEGRGVVLLGHSQGAGMISRLIADEFDGVAEVQDQFVTAHILGTSAPDYDTIPACTTVGELGCVISYATFRASAPPPANSFFGRNDAGPALCTNPANLAGSAATTRPEYLFNAGPGIFGSTPFADPADAEAITTAWIGFPDFVVAECVDDGTFGYYSVEVLGDPADPRADDIGGDLTAEWGLHLGDAQVALGDLVALVEAQVEAYAAATG